MGCPCTKQESDRTTEATDPLFSTPLHDDLSASARDEDAKAVAIAALDAATQDAGAAVGSGSGASGAPVVFHPDGKVTGTMQGPTDDDGGAYLDALLEAEEELRKKTPGPAPRSGPIDGTNEDLRSGDLVEICGLKSAADLNGQRGRVGKFFSDSGRWEVALVDGQVKALSPSNLIVRERGTADELRPGDLVEVTGLKSAAEFNGQRGRVGKLNGDSGRWEVALANGEVKALLPNSLILRRGEFMPGDLVEISALKSAADLNGQRGRVGKLIPDSGRWEVVLTDGQVKALHADNLIFREAGSASGANEADKRATPTSAPQVHEPKVTDPEFKPGDVVEIVGLQKATILNGQIGGIVRAVLGDTGRWEVVLKDRTTKSFRSENLVFKEHKGILTAEQRENLKEEKRVEQEAEHKKKQKEKDKALKKANEAAEGLGCQQQ